MGMNCDIMNLFEDDKVVKLGGYTPAKEDVKLDEDLVKMTPAMADALLETISELRERNKKLEKNSSKLYNRMSYYKKHCDVKFHKPHVFASSEQKKEMALKYINGTRADEAVKEYGICTQTLYNYVNKCREEKRLYIK